MFFTNPYCIIHQLIDLNFFRRGDHSEHFGENQKFGNGVWRSVIGIYQKSWFPPKITSGIGQFDLPGFGACFTNFEQTFDGSKKQIHNSTYQSPEEILFCTLDAVLNVRGSEPQLRCGRGIRIIEPTYYHWDFFLGGGGGTMNSSRGWYVYTTIRMCKSFIFDQFSKNSSNFRRKPEKYCTPFLAILPLLRIYDI